MVFVWSRLTDGDPLFTLSQVALNDTIMVFAFAPIVGLLLGLSSITVPWDTLAHVGRCSTSSCRSSSPRLWRKALLRRGQATFDARLARSARGRSRLCSRRWCSCSRSRARRSSQQPLVIAMLAVPILIQVFFNSALAYC